MAVRHFEPREPLYFVITDKHVRRATQKDARSCVVAQAMKDKFGNTLIELDVQRTRTTLIFTGGITRTYQTPSILRTAIDRFDDDKNKNKGDNPKWNLTSGTYCLQPVPPSATRKAVQVRAHKRRLRGDFHMETKYKNSGRTRKHKMSHRLINFKALQKSMAAEIEAKSKAK